jgi:hypothetical protein
VYNRDKNDYKGNISLTLKEATAKLEKPITTTFAACLNQASTRNTF